MKMLRKLCAAVIALTAASFPIRAQAPATIYLIRHAEKPTESQPDLSPVGHQRAAALPRLFAAPSGSRTLPALPVPAAIFATQQSAKSNRPVETVTPLAEALQLSIHSDRMNEDFAGLAHELLGGSYAHKVVLVAWHHGKIPQLAILLGARPPYVPWPDTQFDRIWRIDYHHGKATLTDLPQQLMPGDSK